MKLDCLKRRLFTVFKVSCCWLFLATELIGDVTKLTNVLSQAGQVWINKARIDVLYREILYIFAIEFATN